MTRAIAGRLIIAGLACFAGGSLRAEDDKPNETAAVEAGAEVAAAIELAVLGENGGPAELVEQPLLRFGDPARDNGRGTVWVWTCKNRPAALMELYFNTQTGARVQVVASLAGSSLTATGGDGFVWKPEKPGIEFRPIDGPLAATSGDVRLLQMKAIARRFRAHEFWDPDNSRYELRLLPQPVYRYDVSSNGTPESAGAIFLLAHGTNPEIALLIETATTDAGGSWRIAAARLGHAEMHLAVGKEEVWKADRVDTTFADETYHLFHFIPADDVPALGAGGNGRR